MKNILDTLYLLWHLDIDTWQIHEFPNRGDYHE